MGNVAWCINRDNDTDTVVLVTQNSSTCRTKEKSKLWAIGRCHTPHPPPILVRLCRFRIRHVIEGCWSNYQQRLHKIGLCIDVYESCCFCSWCGGVCISIAVVGDAPEIVRMRDSATTPPRNDKRRPNRIAATWATVVMAGATMA